MALENVDVNALGLYTLGIEKIIFKKDVSDYLNSLENIFKESTSRLTDYSSSYLKY